MHTQTPAFVRLYICTRMYKLSINALHSNGTCVSNRTPLCWKSKSKAKAKIGAADTAAYCLHAVYIFMYICMYIAHNGQTPNGNNL